MPHATTSGLRAITTANVPHSRFRQVMVLGISLFISYLFIGGIEREFKERERLRLCESSQTGNSGDTPHCLVAYLYEYLGVERQIKVNS